MNHSTPYYADEHASLYLGDCVEVMASLPAESVDAIITSPPYAEQRKSTYGGIPEAAYPGWTVAWMEEARRLLKPDGSVIINISPHIKGGVLSDYVLRTRLALRDDAWAELGELIWHKNGIPTAPNNRPRRSWESLLWYGKHGRAFADAKAAGEPSKRQTWANTSGQHTRRADFDKHFGKGGTNVTPKIARVPDVIKMATTSETTGHPAPFPWQLAEWCGKLVCPPGGTILDPFNGSASTGVAALRNDWKYIGIDAVEEYLDISVTRLARETDAQGAFDILGGAA